ncbi:MAG: VCBS repeat-containing protein [Flavobacteriales bacterium]|nr:VCBS repeat-containing protein [Flavobacteriales bacterium]
MKRPPAVFSMDRDRIKPAFDHRENDFNDFEKEILLPHRMSQQGPAIAVADVDGDGDEDFFAGGGADEPNAFYLQTTEGRFMRAATPGYSGNSKSEVLGAVFFDADNDGDPDLYIATGGGGEFTAGDSLLKDELLINDGKGSFTSGNDRIPILYRCSKVVKPCDFDLDGDIDLFVGGRNIPGAYPMAEPSVLLENRKGVFSVSEKFKLASDEMWSDALWTDTNGDSLPDLVLAGEWTAVCVYVNEGSQFRYCGECTDENRTGWWSSLVSADFDHDGDMDLIAGNLGLNNKFKPSPEKPLELWLNDFDGNGTRDIVLSKHYRNKVVPVRGRECSSAQMPGLVKKVPSYLEFASASLEELYSPELLKSAYYRKATGFSSVYLENRNGHFVAEELDIRIQMAPVNAMVIGDYNGDGHDDVVGVGNNFTTEVETIPYDAGLGWVMYGRGDGSFDVKTQLNESGIFAPGDVKTMVPVKAGNDVGYLVGRNDERLLLLIIK